MLNESNDENYCSDEIEGAGYDAVVEKVREILGLML
jgi:hypothetical protein